MSNRRPSEGNPLSELLIENNKLREWLYEDCSCVYEQQVFGLDIPTDITDLVDQNSFLFELVCDSCSCKT